MKYLIIAVVVFILLALVAKKLISKKGNALDIKARELMTKREQTMYLALVDALPEYFIFSQVAFTALITSKSQAVRNKFNRKVTDFVICNKEFVVVAIVELDDSTHKGKEAVDAKRDDLLTTAKYNVIRFSKVANKEVIREMIIGKPVKES